MKIILSNSSKTPIYEQIYLQLKEQILADELKTGQSLPSMRQLAKDLNVSLITSKRAYEELEKSGFIYSVVGKGSFVAEQNEEMMKERKMQGIEEQLVTAIKNSKDIGVSLTELKELLTILYREEE
ncbi:GntR family transcriptional regulator [Bacillus sp. RAR_GA_16]|uniref:GntR family transcriptional regulator n=1 Tax=Bacillus sp. RAR_GA_16 TaxID=2876774 RepID=UPI001CD014EB|nr:GntR family transcriptional regulator [Bacillus sp. RAR_GA_16]MCA0172917.1 GntR family transcriptional regulator [Bacillus sp. RAR_GA_16]